MRDEQPIYFYGDDRTVRMASRDMTEINVAGRRYEVTAREILRLAEDCVASFMYHNPWSDVTGKIVGELRRINYAPVIPIFRSYRLRNVRLDPDPGSFLFTFDRNSALRFYRDSSRWSPLFVVIQTQPDEHCLRCFRLVVHPAYNKLLEYCPDCGALLSSAAAVVPAAFATPSSLPSGTANVPPTSSQGVSMRCPGGCGSEILALQPASTLGSNPFTSPCKYGCKVRVDAWNKRFEEAKKKNQPLGRP